MSESKPFKPSQRKLKKLRREGTLLKSQYLTKFISYFFVVVYFTCRLDSLWVEIESLLEYCFSLDSNLLDLLHFTSMSRLMFEILCPLLLLLLVTIVVGYMQVGWTPAYSVLVPKFDRIHPISGLQKILKNSAAIVPKLCTIFLLLGALYFLLREGVIHVVQFFLLHHSLAWQDIASILTQFLYYGLSLLACFVCVDFLMQWSQFLKQHSMSFQEVKDEAKETEGDPQMKHLRKEVQRNLSQKALVHRIRHAKVIIVERSK